MAEIIIIANRKVGSEKVTTALNLAYSLKELGKKVFVAKLFVKGILLTMCDNRTYLSKLLTQRMEEMYQG